MSLSTRSIAVQGIGFGARHVALHGLWMEEAGRAFAGPWVWAIFLSPLRAGVFVSAGLSPFNSPVPR